MTSRLRISRLARDLQRDEHTLDKASRGVLDRYALALKARREELNISRRSLAEKVGVSYGQLSHIENAENWPTVPVFIAIARVLKCGRVPLL